MDKRSLIVVVVLILLVGGFIWLINSLGPNHVWAETYAEEGDLGKEPYGLSILQELFEEQYGADFHRMEDSLDLSPYADTNGLYFFINRNAYYDSTEVHQLIEFANKGNDVVIVSKNVSHLMLDTLLFEKADTTIYPSGEMRIDSVYLGDYYAPSVLLKNPLTKDSVQLHFQSVNDTLELGWTYIFSDYYKEHLNGEVIGYSDSLINGFRFYGAAGSVTLYTTPLLFTNYHLLNETNFNFVNGLLSQYSADYVIWDHDRFYSNPMNFKRQPSTTYNPLGYLLSFKAFRWAWYILLVMGILAVAFNLKRKQRIMPLHQEKTNTSLAFIETVGLLYYQSDSNVSIARKTVDLWLYRIRKRYGIPTLDLDDDFVDQLVNRAQVKPDLARRITDKARAIKYLETVSDELLIAFHQLINEFNKNAR